MNSEKPNPYLHWNKESLEKEAFEKRKLRNSLFRKEGVHSTLYQKVSQEIKLIDEVIKLFAFVPPRYVANQGEDHEAIFDLAKQEIRFTNYPDLVISSVQIVPNSKVWVKIKNEK